jgi:hypothetical protein
MDKLPTGTYFIQCTWNSKHAMTQSVDPKQKKPEWSGTLHQVEINSLRSILLFPSGSFMLLNIQHDQHLTKYVQGKSKALLPETQKLNYVNIPIFSLYEGYSQSNLRWAESKTINEKKYYIQKKVHT